MCVRCASSTVGVTVYRMKQYYFGNNTTASAGTVTPTSNTYIGTVYRSKNYQYSHYGRPAEFFTSCAWMSTSNKTVEVSNWKWVTFKDFEITGGSTLSLCPNVSFDLKTRLTYTSGVTWSGTGVNSSGVFSYGTPGTYTITATRVFDNGTSTLSFTVTVNSNPSLTFSSIPNTCSDGADIDLYNYMNINNGTLTSSTAASAIINNRTFRPSNASAGTHTINWSYTNAGCTSSTSRTITVVADYTVNPGANQSACNNSGSITLTSSTSGVSWSCVSCSYVSAGKFNTNTAPAGTYTVRATKNNNGCIDNSLTYRLSLYRYLMLG